MWYWLRKLWRREALGGDCEEAGLQRLLDEVYKSKEKDFTDNPLHALVWIESYEDLAWQRPEHGLLTVEFRYFGPNDWAPEGERPKLRFSMKQLVGPASQLKFLPSMFSAARGTHRLVVECPVPGERYIAHHPVVEYIGSGVEAGEGDEQMRILDWVDFSLREAPTIENYDRKGET